MLHVLALQRLNKYCTSIKSTVACIFKNEQQKRKLSYLTVTIAQAKENIILMCLLLKVPSSK